MAILAEAIGMPFDNAALGRLLDEKGETDFRLMSQLVDSRGFFSVAIDSDMEILESLADPAILHVRLPGSAVDELHFVVFLGLADSDSVLLADPFVGSVLHGVVPKPVLRDCWTGRALVVSAKRTSLPGVGGPRAAAPGLGERAIVASAWILPAVIAAAIWGVRVGKGAID